MKLCSISGSTQSFSWNKRRGSKLWVGEKTKQSNTFGGFCCHYVLSGWTTWEQPGWRVVGRGEEPGRDNGAQEADYKEAGPGYYYWLTLP